MKGADNQYLTETTPLKKILSFMGWCVVAKLLSEAEKNEDYELCTEINQLFIEYGKQKNDFENHNAILTSDFSDDYEHISETLMQEYVNRAKKYLNITKY